jgi:hypothetical protein
MGTSPVGSFCIALSFQLLDQKRRAHQRWSPLWI